jgi:zinc transporter, ZIP family
MSLPQTVLLGAIAGFTIFLGLPAGRIRSMSAKTRAFLSMISVGILLFLFFDIFSQLSEPVEAALEARDFARFSLLLGILLIGFAGGLLGLIIFEQRVIKSSAVAGKVSLPVRLALTIATGIGLHNFSEGLAIGQSAGRGAIAFALLLIIGFGLHNATEGFGIVGPLIGNGRPSWKFLGLAGLIGGGPTFVGTLIGYFFISDALSVLFLSLAAGALIYIIGELFHLERGPGAHLAGGWGILVGLVFALLTDLILVFVGI